MNFINLLGAFGDLVYEVRCCWSFDAFSDSRCKVQEDTMVS